MIDEYDSDDAFRWLDEHMVESLATPDEAFDWIYMMKPLGWRLLYEAWPLRPVEWREACAYILGAGPPEECLPLLRQAIIDENEVVTVEAANSICSQVLRHQQIAMLDIASVARLRELGKDGQLAKFPEIYQVLEWYNEVNAST